MCIAVLAWQAHPRWQLVVAANRDEYHARPAAPLARWDDGSGIIAGKDLTGGGTWLGVQEAGRLVLITNFRVARYPEPGRPSRGALVTGLLTGSDPEKVRRTEGQAGHDDQRQDSRVVQGSGGELRMGHAASLPALSSGT